LKKLLFISIFFASISLFNLGNAQTYSKNELFKIDSLNTLLGNPKIHDTIRIKAIYDLSEIIYVENIDTIFSMCDEIIAIINSNKNATGQELFVYNKFLAASYNNIAFVHSYHGRFQLALDFNHKALKIREEINELDGLSSSYINLGVLYSDQGDSEKAKEYYLKSLEIDIQLNDVPGQATCYNNLGVLNLDKGNYDKALYYNNKSLILREGLKDEKYIALSLNNIGGIYEELNDYDRAMDYFNRSLKIYEKINSLDGIGHELWKLADINLIRKNLSLAKQQALKSLKISKQIGYPDDIKESARILSEIYAKENKGTKALDMYKFYVEIKDSLNNNVISKFKIQQQAKYEYEKKIVADSIRQAERHGVQIAIAKTKAEEEEKKKKILMIGLIILGVLLILLFGRFKKAKKQKEFIEKQKKLVENQHEQLEEVHQEISDSIKYAERLQKAILPPLNQFNDALKNTFVLFKPKDVVSGDFYWLHTTNDDVYFAAADCTGHGVPGAMVSVVCGDALNRSVKEFGLNSTATILDKTRELVIETFSRSGTDVRDGMDIAFCKIKGNILSFSGANNPLWLVRDKTLLTSEQLTAKSTLVINNRAVIEYKPDKQPIGLYEKMNAYTQIDIELLKGDKIYIFSDGYADQFGGEKGKKMKYKTFKNLLLKYDDSSMGETRNKLDSFLEEWKGNYEQLDDICIIGVSI